MRQKQEPQIPRDIKKVLEQIECWRQTKPKSRAMPAHLWRDAVSLAKRYGPYKVSRLLSVDYTKLKLLSTHPPTPDQTSDVIVHEAHPPTEFVSFSPASLFSPPEIPPTMLELTSPEGHSLVVRTHQPLDFPELVHSFWRQGG